MGFFRGRGNGMGMWSFTRNRYLQSMFIPELTIFIISFRILLVGLMLALEVVLLCLV